MKHRNFLSVVCALLCVVFVFALIGCGNYQTNPIKIGTIEKRYELYEPVSQLENIECDLYYTLVSPAGERSGFYTFGSSLRNVDKWRSYKLEERNDGSFIFDFTTEIKPLFKNETPPPSDIAYYDKSAVCNYSGLENDRFTYVHAYKVADFDGNIYEDRPAYYSNFAVDSCVTEWEVAYGNIEHLCRIWSVRIFIIFENDDARITLHEYSVSFKIIIHSENDPYVGIETVLQSKLPG